MKGEIRLCRPGKQGKLRILQKLEKWEMFNLKLSVDRKLGLAIKVSDRSSGEGLSLTYSRNL